MKRKPRDIQVRHRLSGAAMLGMREPVPPTMAVDAAPRAGDPEPVCIGVTRGYNGFAPTMLYYTPTRPEDNES